MSHEIKERMVAFVRGKLDSEKVEDRYKSLGLLGPLPYVENTNGRTFLDISYNISFLS